ncbi:conserved Plasmodium protein, unknown function [Plasmodium vinckei lentum]|uniref:RAVE complex protein Rav1 C-terminal domain-containing protein n=1 Tax=Plasmodium vinckei lentum TaxID=138297 RepID=A0A6V7SHU1_PLAVN|nr:conserved Plasmodium protein, unknown function [Plasmodium vinckei lentum]
MSKQCHDNASNIRDSSVCYDEYNNEDLLHLNKKIKINKNDFYKNPKNGYKENNCYEPLNSYDIFPHGGLYYYDIIIKDILKYGFSNKNAALKYKKINENCDNESYVYLGAGVLKKEQKSKKHRDKNKMVFIFFVNEVLLKRLRSKERKQIKWKKRERHKKKIKKTEILANTCSPENNENSNIKNDKSHNIPNGDIIYNSPPVKEEDAKYQDKNRDGIFLKRKRRKRPNNRLNDINYILNEKIRNKNMFVKTKGSLFYEYSYLNEAGVCTDVNRNQKSINFETFYNDPGKIDGNTTTLTTGEYCKKNNTPEGCADYSDINDYNGGSDSSDCDDSSYSSDCSDENSFYDDLMERGGENSAPNVYTDKNNIFLLNILHHQNRVYSVKWKEGISENVSILVSICYDGYMYIWKEQTNCENKITFVSICRIYILYFEKMVSNIKWCWVKKENESDYYNFIMSNVTTSNGNSSNKMNIAKNEYLIVYGCKNKLFKRTNMDITPYKMKNRIKNCIYFSEFENTSDEKDFMIFSVYAIFNIYNNNIYIKNILNYENVPININFNYIINAKIEYSLLSTSLISIYTDDTYIPNNEYNIKYGEWKIKRVCDYLNNFLLNKNNSRNYLNQLKKSYISNFISLSSCSDSSCSSFDKDYNDEKNSQKNSRYSIHNLNNSSNKRRSRNINYESNTSSTRTSEKIKERNFIFLQKLLNVVNNLMPPFSLKISTKNSDFYKIIIKPNDIWIKKKKSIGVRYILDYKNYECSKSYANKYHFLSKGGKKNMNSQLFYNIDFNNNQNVLIMVDKLNSKLYLYDFSTCIKLKHCTNFDTYPDQEIQNIKIDEGIENDKFTDMNINRYINNQDVSSNIVSDIKHEHNNDEQKPKRKTTKKFSLICCLNSIYIDKYYILKYKIYNFLKLKTHFIYSYSNKICNYYEHLKANKKNTISAKEFLEQKKLIPLVYKSKMIENFDSFFLLMCIDKNRENIFVLKSEKTKIVQNLKMICIFDENKCGGISNFQNKGMHFNILNERKGDTKYDNNNCDDDNTMENNKYLNKVKQDIAKVEKGSFKITDYVIKDFHLASKNDEKEILLTIKYTYTTNDYNHGDNKKKRKKNAYLLIISTLQICKENFIYINLKLKNMFTFFSPINANFLFSYFYLSYQNVYIIATNHAEASHTYSHDSVQNDSDNKSSDNQRNNYFTGYYGNNDEITNKKKYNTLNSNIDNSENVNKNRSSIFYENNYEIFKSDEENSLFSFERRKMKIIKNGHTVLVNFDDNFEEEHSENKKKQQTENNDHVNYKTNTKFQNKKHVVNFYLIYPNSELIINFFQIKNIANVVQICLYDNFVSLITHNKLHIFNFNNICNNLISEEVSFCGSTNSNKRKGIDMVSLSFPKILRNKIKSKIFMTCSGGKDVYFIVASFLVNIKKINKRINNTSLHTQKIEEKGNYYYASVILFNNIMNKNKWNVLKYKNSYLIFSRNIYFLENNLLFLKKLGFEYEQTIVNQGRLVEDEIEKESIESSKDKKINEKSKHQFFVDNDENSHINSHGNSLSFQKINLFRNFKKYTNSKMNSQLKRRKPKTDKSYRIFYHPIKLLNYIKMGLFSHVNVALKLLLYILLNKLFKNKNKYHIKKSCALHYIFDEKKKMEMYTNLYGDIACVKKCQFLFDLNVINTEIEKLYKNNEKNTSCISIGDVDIDENKLVKENDKKKKEDNDKDKSIFFWDNDAVSLDDFNLYSDDDSEKEKKKNSEGSNNEDDSSSSKNKKTNLKKKDDNTFSSDEWDDDEETKNEFSKKGHEEYEKEEKEFKNYLKCSNVLNLQLKIEEIKMLQILILHMNIPHLNDFFQLLLFCILNSFYYDLEGETKPRVDNDYNNSDYDNSDIDSDNDNSQASYKSDKKNKSQCHCEVFNFNIKKEIIKTEHFHIFNYINDNKEIDISSSLDNFAQVASFFSRLYINCYFLLNIKIDMHYSYCYFLYFINQMVGKNIYKYLESFIANYKCFFIMNVTKKDLLSVDLFNPVSISEEINRRMEETKRKIKENNRYYSHMVHRRSVINNSNQPGKIQLCIDIRNELEDNIDNNLIKKVKVKKNIEKRVSFKVSDINDEESRGNEKVFEVNLSNIEIAKKEFFELETDNILKYSLFNLFKDMNIFYYMHNKEMLFYIHDVLVNRTIKKINTINVDDKEKNNEFNECMDFLALLYLAKNEKQKLMVFYKIKKQNKIYDFLSNDFKIQKWINALLNNAYKLMQIKRYYLAIAFFILLGDVKDIVDVIHQYLRDTQLAIFIIRLIYFSYCETDEIYNNAIGCVSNENEMFKYNPILAKNTCSQSNEQVASLSLQQNEDHENSDISSNVSLRSISIANESISNFGGSIQDGKNTDILSNAKENNNKTVKDSETFENSIANFLPKYLNYIFEVKLSREKKSDSDLHGYTSIDSESSCSVYKNDYYYELNKNKSFINKNAYFNIIKFIILEKYEDAYSECEKRRTNDFSHILIKNVIKNKLFKKDIESSDKLSQSVNNKNSGSVTNNFNAKLDLAEFYFCSQDFLKKNMYNLSFIFYFVFFYNTMKDEAQLWNIPNETKTEHLISSNSLFQFCKQYNPMFVILFEIYIESYIIKNRNIFSMLFFSTIYKQMCYNILLYNNFEQNEKKEICDDGTDNTCVNFLSHIKLLSKLIYSISFRIYNSKVQNEDYVSSAHQSGGIYNSEENVAYDGCFFLNPNASNCNSNLKFKGISEMHRHPSFNALLNNEDVNLFNTSNNIMGEYDLYYGNSLGLENDNENKSIVIPFIKKIKNIEYVDSFGKKQNVHIFLTNFFSKLTYLCNKNNNYVINSFILCDHFCNEEKKENNWYDEEYHISLNKYNNILNNFFTYIFYLYIINEKTKSDVMIFIINNITSIFFIYINDIVSIISNFLRRKKKTLLYLHVPFLQLIFLRIILSNYFVYEKRQEKLEKKRNRNYGKQANECDLKTKMENSKCYNTYNTQENIKNISDINKMGIKIHEKYFFYYIHLIDLFICYISVMVICMIMLKKYYHFFENVGVEIDKENSMRFDRKANKNNKEDIYGHNKRQTLKKLFGILHLFLKKIKKMNWDVENVYKRKTTITTALLKFIKNIYLCKKKTNNKIRFSRMHKGNRKTKQHSEVENGLSEEANFFYKYNNECTNELIEKREKNITKKGNIISNVEKGIKNDSKIIESDKMNNENSLQNKNLDPFVSGIDHQSSIKSCGYLQKPGKSSFSEVLFERFCIINIFLSIFELLMSNFQIFAYKSNIFTWNIHLKNERGLKKTKRKQILNQLPPINKTKRSYTGNKLNDNLNNQTKSNLKYANFVSIDYNGANKYTHIFYYKTCIMLGVLENISNFINKYFFPKLKLLLYKSAYNVKNTLLTFLSFPFFINKIRTKTRFITCEHFIDSHISYYYNKELYSIWKLNNCTYRTFILFFNKYFYSYNNYMNDKIYPYKNKLLMNITKNNLKLDMPSNGICDSTENKDDIYCVENFKRNELSYNMYEHNLTQKYNQQIENEKNILINYKASNTHDEKVNDVYEYTNRENQYNYNYKKFYDLYNNGFRICEKNYLVLPNVNMEKNGAAYNRSNFLFKKSKSQDKLFTFTSRMNFFKKFKKNTEEKEYLIKERSSNDMASNNTYMNPVGTHNTSTGSEKKKKKKKARKNERKKESTVYNSVDYDNIFKIKNAIVRESRLIMERGNENEEVMEEVIKNNKYLYIQKNYAINMNDNSNICTNEQGIGSLDFHLQNSEQTEKNPQIRNMIELKNKHKHKHRHRHNKIPHTIPLSLLFNNINERHVIEKDKINNSSSTIVYIRRKNKLKKISILDHLKKLNKKCKFINYILYSDLHHEYHDGLRKPRVNVDGVSISKIGHSVNNLNDGKTSIVTNMQNRKYIDMVEPEQSPINKVGIISDTNEVVKLSRSVQNKSISFNESNNIYSSSNQLYCVKRNDIYEEKENKKRVKHDDIYININMNKLLYIYKCMHIQCMHNLTPLCSLLNNYVPNDCSITNFFSNSYNNYFVNNIFFHNFFYTYDNNLVLLLNSGNMDPVRYTCAQYEEYENQNYCKTSGIPPFLDHTNKNKMLEKSGDKDLCQLYKDEETHTQISSRPILIRDNYNNRCDENILPFDNTREISEKLIKNIPQYQPECEMQKSFTISKTAEKYIEKILLLLYNNIDLNERDKINGNSKDLCDKIGTEGTKEFDNLFEYIDKNLNNCLRKKYNFIYNITDQKNNLSYLKTGAIISHPFLPVYALVHINNEKKINTDNELDKYKFKIRLCKFTNKSDDISYKYGDIITSVLWNTNGNLLIISDDRGYLYIYNIFLGNFIKRKNKNKSHHSQGNDVTGTNTNADNNVNGSSYDINKKQDAMKNISKYKKGNPKRCSKNESCYDKETDGNEEYFHYDDEDENDENNGEDNEYEWIEQYGEERYEYDEEGDFDGTDEYDGVDDIERDRELGEFDEHVKQAKNIESEQRKNGKNKMSDNKYNFTSSEAKYSKKKKSDDTSFGSKIKGNNKIRNFFKDNFLKKNKNKSSLDVGGKMNEKNQDEKKKKKKKNIYIHKKGYIIKEAMCIVKLHDEIIDVKCLDDNNFYLITIGKGINTKCINNHTTYINSNYIQNEFNQDNFTYPKETINVHNMNSQDHFLKTNLAKDKNSSDRNMSMYGEDKRLTMPSQQYNVNNIIPTNQQNEITDGYNNGYSCNDTYTTTSKQDEQYLNMTNKYEDCEKWNESNVKQSVGQSCDNISGKNLYLKKKKKNYKEVERKSANNIDTFLNLHVFKKKHSYFKSRFFYFDSPNIVFFNKHKKLKNILQENLCICVWDLCSMLTNEQKVYLLDKKNMNVNKNVNANDIGGNGTSNNVSFEVGQDTLKSSTINKEKNKKLQNIILHPTLVCIISNISKYKNQMNKNKSTENENFITSFCSWVRPTNYMHKMENPFEKEQNEKIKKQKKRVYKNYYSDQIVKSSNIPNQGSSNDFPNSTIIRSIKQNKNSKIIIKAKKSSKQKKSMFWSFFKNKIYSNNFSGDSYIFYGDQMGYIHIIHLQTYKEILCFKAFDVPIFKIFITKIDAITKLLILADTKLRIYEIVAPREICFIKEVEINHELSPKKCICEENLNELKEKRKIEDNENEGMSIFNLSYFLSSNYHKKNNSTRSEEKVNVINNASKNKINFENVNTLSGTVSTLDNMTQVKNKTNTSISKDSYNNNAKNSSIIYKNSISNSSFGSINNFKNISDSDDAENSNKDAYQSVIIGGINFGYLGLNFSKFINNKKNKKIIDAYLLTNSHLVTISSNGTIILIKI